MTDLTDAAHDLDNALREASDGSVQVPAETLARVVTLLAHGTDGGETFAALRAVVAAHPTGPDQDEPAAWADLRKLAHVPNGPVGVDPDEADQAYLTEAAKRVEAGMLGHGSNVTATVAGLLRGVVPALVRAREAQATAPAADEDRFTTDVHEAVTGVDADPTGAVQRTRLRLCDGWRLVPPAAAPGAETTTDEDAVERAKPKRHHEGTHYDITRPGTGGWTA